jgi:hypothetical protein
VDDFIPQNCVGMRRFRWWDNRAFGNRTLVFSASVPGVGVHAFGATRSAILGHALSVLGFAFTTCPYPADLATAITAETQSYALGIALPREWIEGEAESQAVAGVVAFWFHWHREMVQQERETGKMKTTGAIISEPMTLREAFWVAKAEAFDRNLWNQARAVLIKHGYCPSCACGGHRAELRPWEPGGYWTNAGRECYDCEEFVVCGEQPEYGNASDEWRGDADPGL